MKRILIIAYTHSNGGGSEHLLSSYVNSFDSSLYSVSILEIEHFDVKSEHFNNGIKTKKIALSYADKFKHPFFAFFSILNYEILYRKPVLLRSVFNLEQYDVVVSWNYQLPSFFLPAFPDAYRIGMFHGALTDMFENEEHTENNQLEIKRQRQKAAWETADRIVTISHKSFKTLETAFPPFISKSEIIHNGLDIQAVIKKSKENSLIKLDKSNRYLCCCGRLDENKNFKLAIKALSQLTDNTIHLVIIGDGVKKQELVSLANDLGIEDRVHFTGYQKNPYSIMTQCDLFCLTSFSEGFPMVIMEAMALGLPFITTKVSGASEELSYNQKCGIIADWNETDYARKIKSVLLNRELYEKMKISCLDYINSFDLHNSVDKFQSLFEKAEKNVADYRTYCNIKNKLHYCVFMLFFFDGKRVARNWKNKKLKCIIYVLMYIGSLILLPMKLLYVLIYVIMAGR